MMIPAAPLLLVVRLLRPVRLIRFGPLRSERIGHFTLNTESYLCERDVGRQPDSWDLFFCNPVVSNRYLERMWKRVLTITPWARAFYRLCHWIPGGKAHLVEPSPAKDSLGLLDKTSAHLRLSNEESMLGREFLARVGVPEGAAWICFSARDPSFLKTAFPGEEWSHHDYRDCSVANYLPGLESMAALGIYSFRMGVVVKEPLPAERSPLIIEYSGKHRSEFLDIFLTAGCKFFVASTEGLCGLPVILRKPTIHVNHIPLIDILDWPERDLVLPKLLRRVADGRWVPFAEVLALEQGRFLKSHEYEQLGLSVIENSAEELEAVIREMNGRVDGTWVEAPEDIELQDRFWTMFERNFQGSSRRSAKIGADFLRRHRDLI